MKNIKVVIKVVNCVSSSMHKGRDLYFPWLICTWVHYLDNRILERVYLPCLEHPEQITFYRVSFCPWPTVNWVLQSQIQLYQWPPLKFSRLEAPFFWLRISLMLKQLNSISCLYLKKKLVIKDIYVICLGICIGHLLIFIFYVVFNIQCTIQIQF